MSFKHLLPLLLLIPAVAFADSDRNFKVAPVMFKEGIAMQPIANMAISKKESMILSESPVVPLRPNIMFLRHKKGPKEYLWFSGPIEEKNFPKLHAFNLAENYLKPAEVMLTRFYGSQTSRAFQDESDIYFDNEYIYSPRVPKLYFKKNGQWQVLQETDLPGIITIDTTVAPELDVTSITERMRTVPSKLYPMTPGMYAFIFSSPDYLPYVDAVSVGEGGSEVLKPTMVMVDTVAKVKATTSVTLDAVTSAEKLEDVEKLYDKLAADVQISVSKVDTNAFNKEYPPLRRALSLGVSADDSVYVEYKNRYRTKREQAKTIWRMGKMGSASVVGKALHRKLDSLQAEPHQVSLVPSKIEPVYEDETCVASAPVEEKPAVQDSAKADSTKTDSVAVAEPAPVKCPLKSVRLVFGADKERYDVSWSGNVDGYTADSLYGVLTSGTAVQAELILENNQPVWLYSEEGTLMGRHHYRYIKLNLSINGSEVSSHGGFELPNYIFDDPEVQDWLNRPIEEDPHLITEPAPAREKREDNTFMVDVDMKVPRIVRDKDRGNVALIDSGSFRYKGKVVAMSGFAIQTTEVTQQQFKNIMSHQDSTKRIEDRSTFKGPRVPVHNITWDNAQAYCKMIGGDLPTEAQWEFAGRADNNEGALWNLDENPDPGMYAIYKSNSYSLGKKNPAYGPQPVSSKKSNVWGIFDMSGNVAEWTRDSYFMFSLWVEASNPTGAMFGSNKVYKGGSWKDKEGLLNLTDRDDEDPRYWADWIGFRCAFPRTVFEGK